MLIKQQQLVSGGSFELFPTTMVLRFGEERTAISTAEHCGGICKIGGTFNQRIPRISKITDLPGQSVNAYLQLIAEQHTLPKASGLLTSARMQCYGHSIARSGDIIVEVFATAGVDGNAARAGEQPLYQETIDGFKPLGGTINIFVLLSFALSEGMLTRTLITITEAKSALLQELGISSSYNKHTATGTGTDGIVVVTEDCGQLYNDVGTHSEIGYLLASATKQAVARALSYECYRTVGAQLTADGILSCTANSKQAKKEYLKQFRQIPPEQRAELLDALSLWNVVNERNQFGGISKDAFTWFTKELVKKYPITTDWL